MRDILPKADDIVADTLKPTAPYVVTFRRLHPSWRQYDGDISVLNARLPPNGDISNVKIVATRSQVPPF